MTIKTLLLKQKIAGKSSAQIAEDLGVTQAMVSIYKRHNYMPSLATARVIYNVYGEVIFPFSKEAVSSQGYGHEFDTNI
jgi:transcriptional regulator with XRE-family HTH domain